MKNFEAKNNLPFGIKKGDTITEVSPNVYHNSNGVVIPMDVKKESTFFSEIKELKGKFQKDDTIVLTKQEKCLVYSEKPYSRETFVIPAWTELKVIGYTQKFKKLYAIVNFNGRKYEVKDTHIILYEVYYFINSSGQVHKAILKRDKNVDLFRIKSKNFFYTKELADKALDKIITSDVPSKLALIANSVC